MPTTMLQIIDSTTNGGAEKHARLIIKQFALKGYRIFFVFSPGDYAPEFKSLERMGVTCIEYDLKKNLLGSIRFIRGLIQKNDITLIHSHQYLSGFIATLAAFRIKSVRHIITIHTIYRNARVTFSFIKRIQVYAFTFFTYLRAYKIFTLSKAARDITASTFHMRAAKIRVVPNSVDPGEMVIDPERVKTLRKHYIPFEKAKIILNAGLFHSLKGQECLIRAFAEHIPDRNVLLILLGDGDKRQDYQDLIQELNIQGRVILPGFQADICNWYALADIYVQPSLRDNMPNTILEAMYLGIPIIMSDLPTIRDVIINGQTGITFQPGNDAELGMALYRMLYNPEKTAQLAQAGQAFVRSHATMDTLAEAMIAEFDTPGNPGVSKNSR
jgi:glycosyltransferase involved in cell wall biosynthesis